MGFQPPVPQQDTNWEIRAAILASLVLQVFLIFIAPLRRRSASRFARSVVWSCYLLADWVADLCLGLLLNSLGNIGTPAAPVSAHAATPSSSGSGSGGNNTSSPVIFAFWAPFLLLHLGGPDTITAFSIEDNELWRRHLIGLLFELFAAATVFFCSLQGNPFVVASVLMFVVGIVKYAERTYCLYRGSADGLRSSMLGKPDPGPDYAELMEEYGDKGDVTKREDVTILEDVMDYWKLREDSLVESIAFQLYQKFRYLFADLIFSFNERKVSQKFFSGLDAHMAFELIEVELGFVYDIVYTKAAAVHTRAGYALRLIGSACIVTAFLTFFFVDKRGFTRLDVAITYALLVGAVVLDAAALMMLLSSDWTRVFCAKKEFFNNCCSFIENKCSWLTLRRRRRRWSQKVSRLSLIGYCLGEPGRAGQPSVSRLASWLADKLRVKEFLDEALYVRRKKVTEELKEFVFNKLREKALEARDYAKIKEVCEQRGAGALKKLQKESSDVQTESSEVQNASPEVQTASSDVQKKISEVIRECVEVDFDQSLLLWHIATELCYYQDKTSPQTQNDEVKVLKRISMEVSEYLLYLLVMQPAMLSTVAGIGLLRYRDTCAEARRFFRRKPRRFFSAGSARRFFRRFFSAGSARRFFRSKPRRFFRSKRGRQLNGDHVAALLTAGDHVAALLAVKNDAKPVDVKGDRSKSVLFDACILAKQLGMLDVEKKWEVVSEVWAEMLAYAACHCRATAHAGQLSGGGELATVVWLLMAHVGLDQLFQIQSGASGLIEQEIIERQIRHRLAEFQREREAEILTRDKQFVPKVIITST